MYNDLLLIYTIQNLELLLLLLISGNILVEDVRFPRNVNISSEARDLLLGLLVKDPARRLGGGPSDAQEIRSHLFFSVFCDQDWQDLEGKRVSSMPNLSNVNVSCKIQ